jgi:hypothetical protein
MLAISFATPGSSNSFDRFPLLESEPPIVMPTVGVGSSVGSSFSEGSRPQSDTI